MNTDAILDFVIENYIWFIIGGIIILLAILGVVAEKKKVIPKKKKKEEFDKEILNENNEIKDDNAEKVNFEIKNETEIQNNEEINDFVPENNQMPTDNKLEIYEPSHINNEQAVIAEEKNDDADVVVEDNNITETDIEADVPDMLNYADIDNEIMNEIDNRTANNNESTSANLEEKNVGNIFNTEPEIINNKFDSNLLNNQNTIADAAADNGVISNSIKNDYSLSSVDADINRINDLNFSDNESKLDSEKEKDEKLEDTMQISYSQLKEIVQDIIAENDAEEKSEKEDLVEKSSKTETMENNAVEEQEVSNVTDTTSKDKDQQTEEDDVWKF